MLRSLVGLAVVSLAATVASADEVTTFTLPNGMQGIVIEDHRAPVVTHMVWYRAGAADEKRGKSGIAHFLEHLMFKGTKDVPDGQFSKLVAILGVVRMSDLAGEIDKAPAGGIIEVILFVFFVLLVTDILCFTKVFPFTRSIR